MTVRGGNDDLTAWYYSDDTMPKMLGRETVLTKADGKLVVAFLSGNLVYVAFMSSIL